VLELENRQEFDMKGSQKQALSSSDQQGFGHGAIAQVGSTVSLFSPQRKRRARANMGVEKIDGRVTKLSLIQRQRRWFN